MKSNLRQYDPSSSFERLRSIVNQAGLDYKERDELPSRDALTYSNGYYAMCAALFVDIQDSSRLPDRYQRPVLARIYRAFISEAVAILNSNANCREVSIVGDGVWGVFNVKFRTDIDSVITNAAELNSMVHALNAELAKRNVAPIAVGIGGSYGRALMVKAGFAGSGIDDVVYMGDVVNEACHLANAGNQTPRDKTILVSSLMRDNIENDEVRSFFTRNLQRSCWQAELIMDEMEALI